MFRGQQNRHSDLMTWCISGNTNIFMIREIHQRPNSKRANYLRKQFRLEEINQLTLEQLQTDINNYILHRIKPLIPKRFVLDDNHPINVAKYATGTCCRSCLDVCCGIRDYTLLTDEQLEIVSSRLFKWIIGQKMK